MAATALPFAGIVILTVVAMEGVAALVHRYVMHGWGWEWHKSHHSETQGLLERNDLYALVFAAFSVVLFAASARVPLLWPVGLGLALYGVLYAMVHDGLVHGRFPFVKAPRSGYLKRLVQAHRLHHAVRVREGAVSFGFLYAPPIKTLLTQLSTNREAR